MQKVDVLPHGPPKKGTYFNSAFDFTRLLAEWLAEHSDRQIVCNTFLPDKTQVGWLMIVHDEKPSIDGSSP